MGQEIEFVPWPIPVGQVDVAQRFLRVPPPQRVPNRLASREVMRVSALPSSRRSRRFTLGGCRSRVIKMVAAAGFVFVLTWTGTALLIDAWQHRRGRVSRAERRAPYQRATVA